MWILILALYASPYAGNAFSTLHTQEFDTATACQQAAKQFAEKFETFETFKMVASGDDLSPSSSFNKSINTKTACIAF